MQKLSTIPYLFAFWFVLSGCSGFERNNPLDPKSSGSYRNKVMLVEAFVNDATPFSPYSLSAIDALKLLSESEIVFLEYHVTADAFLDEYSIAAAKTRYDFYETQNRAVPDVFLNGMSQRVQGAASYESALERLQAAYGEEKDVDSRVTIEAQYQIESTAVTLNVKVARLGRESLSGFDVVAAAFEDTGLSGHHHVVRHIWPGTSMSALSAGDNLDFVFTNVFPRNTSFFNWRFVVFVQENRTKKVLQTVLLD